MNPSNKNDTLRLRDTIIVTALLFSLLCFHTAAYDPLDPNGNITVKWDVLSWIPDGYVAVVTIHNFQMYRHIMKPGWTLGWSWANREIIWSMVGAEATDQGDCSKFTSNNNIIPHSCDSNPTIVDLLPGVPYNQQVPSCCKAGILSSWGQDPAAAARSSSSFQITVGTSGNTNTTLRLPKNFTLLGPGLGYTCGTALKVPQTVFLSPDGRRKTRAMMTWNVTCSYSQFLASKNPTCCVSLSSFYNDTIIPCTYCACGCPKKNNCILRGEESNIRSSVVGAESTATTNGGIQCTQHMCPVRVHWHVKTNYKEHWRVKISITNFNYQFNYTQWTLVAQHPNLSNLTQVFSFQYKPLMPYQYHNDTGMFYGIKYYNEMLLQAGPDGNLQSEMILRKDINTFTFKEGWAFPKKVYFNGDECTMPPPDSYPFLPNSARATYGMACLKVVALVVLVLLSIV